jgi:hypothetical protein
MNRHEAPGRSTASRPNEVVRAVLLLKWPLTAGDGVLGSVGCARASLCLPLGDPTGDVYFLELTGIQVLHLASQAGHPAFTKAGFFADGKEKQIARFALRSLP